MVSSLEDAPGASRSPAISLQVFNGVCLWASNVFRMKLMGRWDESIEESQSVSCCILEAADSSMAAFHVINKEFRSICLIDQHVLPSQEQHARLIKGNSFFAFHTVSFADSTSAPSFLALHFSFRLRLPGSGGGGCSQARGTAGGSEEWPCDARKLSETCRNL